MALSLFLMTAYTPEKKAKTPQRPAMTSRLAETGSLKNPGLSLGPTEITIVLLKTKNRTNSKIASMQNTPGLLLGISQSLIFVIPY
jgi:hypothetical protein